MSEGFSHVNEKNEPGMVDVAAKAVTARSATVIAEVRFPRDVADALKEQGWTGPKGPILHTAIVAGTQAVKRTWDLIPFCHPLPIEGCKFEHTLTEDVLEIRCTVRATHKTGVEMEAFTGATMAAVTIIDMCKARSPHIQIQNVRLIEKRGGKSDLGVRA